MFKQWTQNKKISAMNHPTSPESIRAKNKLEQSLINELKKLEVKYADFVTAKSNQRHFGSQR